MLKQFSSCLLFASFCFTSTAQKNKFSYGFQTGVIINSASGTAIYNHSKSTLTGFSFGGHLKVQTSNHVAFKVLLSYEQNGWVYRNLYFQDATGTSPTGLALADVYNKLHYLNLPILTEYSFGNKIKFSLDGGIFLGFLVHNKSVIKIKDPTAPDQSFKSNARHTINWGVSAGAAVQFPIRHKLKLDFGLRNNFGLANINKSQDGGNSSIRTNAFSILTGLSFEL